MKYIIIIMFLLSSPYASADWSVHDYTKYNIAEDIGLSSKLIQHPHEFRVSMNHLSNEASIQQNFAQECDFAKTLKVNGQALKVRSRVKDGYHCQYVIESEAGYNFFIQQLWGKKPVTISYRLRNKEINFSINSSGFNKAWDTSKAEAKTYKTMKNREAEAQKEAL